MAKKTKSMYALLTIALNSLLHTTVQSTSEAPESNFLQVPALGRSANLGYLYDARTETFQDVYIFKAPITSSTFVTQTHTPYTFTEMNFANTFAEKNNLFNIDAYVSASVLGGLIKIKGSATYLTEEKHSARQTEGVMMIKSRTIAENLQVYYDSLRPWYNLDLLNQTTATHLLTGVQWGANVAISFRDTAHSSYTNERATGKLNLAFDKLKGLFSVEGSGSVDLGALNRNLNTEFSVKIYGDINIPNEFPQTYSEVYSIVRKVPEYIEQSNGGNGVQLEYTLTPISYIREHLKFDFKQNEFFQELDEAFLTDFVQVFDDISLTEQHLNDVYDDLSMYTVCIPSETKTNISNLRNSFLSAKIGLKSAVKSKLVSVRSGVGQPKELVTILDNYMKDTHSVQAVETRLNDFAKPLDKIELYKILTTSYSNIMYLGHRSNLKAEILKKENGNRIVYVLLMKPISSEADDLNLQESMSLFLHDLNQPANQLFVVDCEFGQVECIGLSRSTILQYFNGEAIVKDVQAAILNQGKSKKDQQGTSSNLGILDPLKLKAVGRFAEIGELYDARSDSFVGQSILQHGYSALSLIEANEKDESDAFIVESETILGKFKSLEIDPEQQLSIVAEQNVFVRSGQYLKVPPINDGFEFNGRQSVIYTQCLNEEEIITESPEFSGSLDLDGIRKFPGTHFVSKILYGYNTIFSLEPPLADSSLTLTELRANVDKNLKALRSILTYMGQKDNETVISEEDISTLDTSLKFQIFSDIQNSESGPELIDGNKHLLDYFNYKFYPVQADYPTGKPISYVLTPLKNLQKFGVIGHDAAFTLIGQSPENSMLVNDYVVMSETLKKAELKISSLYTELQNNPLMATDGDFTLLKRISNNFNSKFGNFTKELRSVMLRVKSNEVEIQALGDLYSNYGSQVTKCFGEDGRYLEFDEMRLVEEKLELSKKLGVTYLGRDSRTRSFNLVFSYSDSEEGNVLTLALAYKPVWVKEKASLWQSRSQEFFGNVGKNISGGKIQLIIVDCDFNHPPCKNVTEPTILQYSDGQFLPKGRLAVANESSDIYDNLLKRLQHVETKYELLEKQLKKAQ